MWAGPTLYISNAIDDCVTFEARFRVQHPLSSSLLLYMFHHLKYECNYIRSQHKCEINLFEVGLVGTQALTLNAICPRRWWWYYVRYQNLLHLISLFCVRLFAFFVCRIRSKLTHFESRWNGRELKFDGRNHSIPYFKMQFNLNGYFVLIEMPNAVKRDNDNSTMHDKYTIILYCVTIDK